MEPRSHEEHIRHTFDAFCKKVLRNEARDYLDELARRRSREISFSELPVEVMEQLSVCDDYFAEDRTFDVLGYIVQIASDELAEAITSLPAEKRNIMDLYHPYYYAPSDAEELKKTLYIFTDSYMLINRLFPQASGEMLLDHLIAIGATEAELVELRTVLFNSVGVYVGIQSMEAFIASAEAGGTRTHQTYLLFYISASVALIGAMLANMMRSLSFMMPTYSIHHLFGASGKHIFMRMLLFTAGYNILPLCGIALILSRNMLASPVNIIILVLTVLTVATIISAVKFRQFKICFSQGLRRD